MPAHCSGLPQPVGARPLCGAGLDGLPQMLLPLPPDTGLAIEGISGGSKAESREWPSLKRGL